MIKIGKHGHNRSERLGVQKIRHQDELDVGLKEDEEGDLCIRKEIHMRGHNIIYQLNFD